MKYLFLMVFVSGCSHLNHRSVSQQTAVCHIGKNDCTADQVCMNITATEAQCRQIPDSAPFDNIVLPFSKNTEVVCTHSSGDGSHSWPNAFYALDLATPYDLPASTIYAALGGIAYVYGDVAGKTCPELSGEPKLSVPDNCGDGWGNNIKIVHSNGYYSFYVHLDHILIKNGQTIKQGDPIGVEGYTGKAGHRHLHWSFQKIQGSNQADWDKNISWTGSSVPFKFKAILNGVEKIINSSDLQCPHENIEQVPGDVQPKLRGVL